MYRGRPPRRLAAVLVRLSALPVKREICPVPAGKSAEPLMTIVPAATLIVAAAAGVLTTPMFTVPPPSSAREVTLLMALFVILMLPVPAAARVKP